MDRHNSKSIFVRRTAGITAIAILALVMGLSLAPTGTPPAIETQGAPTYDSLQALLRDGKGKGLDRGLIDVWASTTSVPLAPTAWVWVEDDPVDGSGVEYWAYHADFVHPNADEEVTLTYVYREDADPTSVQDFLEWIVEANDNVDDAGDLTVVMNTVSDIPSVK